MYGTIGHYRIKPGMEARFRQLFQEQERALGHIPGFVAIYGYCMDANPNDYFIAAVFESREAYWANSQSPEQDTGHRQRLPLLEGEPEWHDGEIVIVYPLNEPGQG
jgi:heme-degrading monooxygenase HmoA